MTERQGSAMDLIEVLRDRFGVRYQIGHDAGRREILSVIGDRMGVGHADAETLLRQHIDAGHIRYVPAHESDPVADREAQHDEHSDRDSRAADDYTDRGDSLRINAIPGQGGPGAATSGVGGPPVGAIAAGGTTGLPAAAAPLAIGANAGTEAGDFGGGYWEFGGDTAGVVPSSTRKGQVEPRGT